MQVVEDPPMETIHIYYEQEEPPRPRIAPIILSTFFLLLVLTVGIFSPNQPLYEYKTLTIPAHFFTRTYFATALIMPTGVKTYPATASHGILTIYNGSIITQTIPAGLIVTASTGMEFVVEYAVTVPAGNPPSYGVATVEAYALIQGKQGNIKALDINRIYGSSLYIRNLSMFQGGKDSYCVSFVTPQDRQTAIDAARASLTAQEAQIRAIVAKPCKETNHIVGARNMVVNSTCQFATYPNLPGMKVTHVRLVGNKLLVDVEFVARLKRIWVK